MDTHLKNFQRINRSNMSLPEVIIWQSIRRKSLGVRFRRQYAIGNRIFDFYCPEKKLAIEIDGESHYENGQQKVDLQGDALLKKQQGIIVLRFLNHEVMKNVEGVMERIMGYL